MLWEIFNTGNNKYIYDRTKNRIANISDNEYYALLEIKQSNNNEVLNDDLKRLINNGFLCKNQITEIKNSYSDNLQYFLNNMCEELLLQVTQKCNLRCEYCTYSGNYNNSNRVHTNDSMSLLLASNCIDFFMKCSNSSDNVTIGFYGGEPLIEIDLIKSIVDYIESKYKEKNIRLSITTNGTLLNNENVEYLNKKNFTIMVSIDGPKSIHDKYRCFINGNGSYDKVEKNLLNIKHNYLNIYKSASTNTVLNTDTDIKCVIDYLSNNEIISPLSSHIGFLSDCGMDDEFIYNENVNIEYKKMELYSMLSKLGFIKEKKQYGIFGDYFNVLNQSYQMLTIGEFKSNIAHPGGPCLVGARRLFVDLHGNFYPCEKITESPEMTIGNIYEGLDIDKIYNMINIGINTQDECKNCWAFLFCNQCIVTSINSKGFSIKKRLNKCKRVRANIHHILESITILQEIGYDFYKFY